MIEPGNDLPVPASLYAVTFHYERDDAFHFYSQWVRCRRAYKGDFYPLSAFDFEKLWLDAMDDGHWMLQFEVIVEWNPKDGDDLEEWQKAPPEQTVNRYATITLDLRKVAAVRQIYYNAEDTIPPFRHED